MQGDLPGDAGTGEFREVVFLAGQGRMHDGGGIGKLAVISSPVMVGDDQIDTQFPGQPGLLDGRHPAIDGDDGAGTLFVE